MYEKIISDNQYISQTDHDHIFLIKFELSNWLMMVILIKSRKQYHLTEIRAISIIESYHRWDMQNEIKE